MGWLWSSSPKPAAGDTNQANDVGSASLPTESQQSSFGLSEEQRMRIFGRPEAGQQQTNVESREEQADAELNAFLKSFEASDAPAPGSPTIIDPKTKEIVPSPMNHDRILPDGGLNIHPTALNPATMNCRQAFDQAFYCHSLGGKFNDIYRFGHLKDCTEQWGAFWFCMRTRTLPSRDKEGQIREYYRLRDEKRKKENGGNSEDIWELRTKPVERAFWKDPDAEESEHGVQVKE